MQDPRKDLKEDTLFWELALTCATAYRDKRIFSNLHGFRCSGARLALKKDTLALQFSSEWSEVTKQEMKKKYALPYIEQFKILFKFAVEYLSKHNEDAIKRKETDFFTRDISREGYPI